MQRAAVPSSSVSSEAGASTVSGMAAAAVAGTIRNFSEDL